MRRWVAVLGAAAAVWGAAGFLQKTDAAILYKHYAVRQHQDQEILCEPYVVKKDDYILKIFRRKGEIALRDYSRFIDIFKGLNPEVSDIDHIHPGQRILIPLTIISPDTFPDQKTGTVTIPFITISNVHKLIKPYLIEYTVQKGDTVSKLLASGFGSKKQLDPQEALKLFTFINPQITDLNRIYPGQKIRLIHPDIGSAPWYAELFDADGNIVRDLYARTPESPSESRIPKLDRPEAGSLLRRLAMAVNAKLARKGVFYFPRNAGADLRLALGEAPLLTLADETRILFVPDQTEAAKIELIRTYWPDLRIVPHDVGAGSLKGLLETIWGSPESGKSHILLTDSGLKLDVRAQWIISQKGGPARRICITAVDSLDECTPQPMTRYLQKQGIILKELFRGEQIAQLQYEGDHNRSAAQKALILNHFDRCVFVKALAEMFGARYLPDARISFPYAGIQVEAACSLIALADGRHLGVDYGDLYGEAVTAIRQSGLDMIQITAHDTIDSAFQKLAQGFGIRYTVDPVFYAAERPPEYNIALTVPGYLVSDSGPRRILISKAPLDNDLLSFLKGKAIRRIITIAAKR